MGLQRPRTEKRPDKLWERIGRPERKTATASVSIIKIDLQTDESGEKALSITWQKHSVPGSYVDHPRVFIAAQ